MLKKLKCLNTINSTTRQFLKKIILSKKQHEQLVSLAKKTRVEHHSNKVYLRCLVEFSNYCKNNCFYCGIRKDNANIIRYRLTPDEILKCCERGYNEGIKTFVLQSGEDSFYTDDLICKIIDKIKSNFHDCVITLSIGEKSKKSYESFFKAGADRFLLREETANQKHYEMLHPSNMSLKNRKECLFNLKKIGFKVGGGFLINSPFQTIDNILDDLCFLKELNPFMIGIGPFIAQKDTPFKNYKNGSVFLTLRMIAILRLMFPKVMLPATTALFTLSPDVLKQALDGGANVLMLNFNLKKYQSLYKIYDNKFFRKEKTTKNIKKLIYLCGYKFSHDEKIY